MKKLVFILAGFLITACNSDTLNFPDNNVSEDYKFTERITVYTDSEPMMCTVNTDEYIGVAGLCHRRLKDDKGETISVESKVGDFKLEMGTSYVLVVDKYDYLEPEQDGVSFFLELVEVKSAEQDPVGTKYFYDTVYLYNDAFYRTENEDVFGSGVYQFLCAEDVDCNTLVDMSNGGGIISVEFTLLETEEAGQLAIYLTDWQ